MGGTLFLDEVADLPAAAQVRLLQALQGAGRVSERSPDVRVVGATRVDLRARMEQGAFRDDLFYRLNVLPVVVPPLRERGEDVQLLADYFLWQLSDGTGRPPRRLSAAARNALKTYAWPGNVRELQNAITRAVTLCPGDCIDVEHLALGSRPSVAPLASSLRAEERRRIDEALARTGGRKAEAAELLGISRKTLWEKLKRRNTS
jgi:DNA-binding NtrC family response regulator